MPATNKIILGTVQFGLNYGINNTSGKPNQTKVNAILNTAYNSNIRCLDTAEAYGNAHQVIGQFHKSHPQQVFNIITKLPHDIDETIDEKIEKYLQELNITKLEGLLFHSYQTYKNNKNAMNLLNKYKHNGKVKYLGVSVYTNEQAEDVVKDKNVDIIQLPFNLFDNINQRGAILKKAKQNNKIVHTRSAFLQGMFFAALNKQDKVIQLLNTQLKYIQKISTDSGMSLQKIALNYCLQQHTIDNVLIGVDNLEQLNKNLSDADYALSEDLINKINSISIENTNLLNPSLWNQ